MGHVRLPECIFILNVCVCVTCLFAVLEQMELLCCTSTIVSTLNGLTWGFVHTWKKHLFQFHSRKPWGFSHFCPRQELILEKRFTYDQHVPKISGSQFLEEQIRRIHPRCHVFGHTHVGWDTSIAPELRMDNRIFCWFLLLSSSIYIYISKSSTAFFFALCLVWALHCQAQNRFM